MLRPLRLARLSWAALLAAVVVAFVSLSAAPGVAATTSPHDPAAVKSALIGKIAGFIRWPAEAGLDDPNRPFEIVVLGVTPLASTLRAFYLRSRIAGHHVFVRTALEVREIGRPHLLFIPANERERLAEVLGALGARAVLTVGDGAGFAAEGMAVNLFEEGRRMRFEISRSALRRHGLQASYQLLQLARLVGEDDPLVTGGVRR